MASIVKIQNLLTTSNYDMFDFDEKNRSIKPSKVVKLCNELERKNLLHHFPILVIKNNYGRYTILDGQHRFMACKKLDIDVVYKICKDMSMIDVSYINSVATSWGNLDYVNYFSKQGKEDYVFLKHLMDKTGITDIRSLTLICGTDASISTANSKFRLGTWKVKNNSEMIDYYTSNILFVKNKLNKSYATSQRFVGAFTNLLNKDFIDNDLLISQLEKYPQKLHKCTNKEEYEIKLLDIYNYNISNSKKINLKHFFL